MDFQEINSSNVAGVAWEDGTLHVKYRDGGIYSCPATAAEHADLLASPSKGTHLALHFRTRLKITGKDQPAPPAAAVAQELATHDDDLCCSGRLSKALRAGQLDGKYSWECPKCGVEWRAKRIDGIKHWAPHCPVLRF